jgi:hypothetical protein
MAIKATFLDAQTNEWVDVLQALDITLTAPAGGEVYSDGDSVSVTWTLDNPDVVYRDPNAIQVKLDRSNAGTFSTTVVSSVEAEALSTSFAASPPPGDARDKKARIRLYDAQTNAVLATSNYFTLKTDPVKASLNGAWVVAG